MIVADVVPLVPAWALDRSFSYAVPPGRPVAIGSLVRVTLGNRKVRGIVVSLAERDDDGGLQEVLGIVLPDPIAPPPMPEVLERLALRYPAPRGVVFDRVVPPRVRVKPQVGVRALAAEIPSLDGYEGASDLQGALHDGRGGVWIVQAALSDDRARIVCDLAGAVSGQVLVCVPEVRWGSPVIAGLQESYPDAARLDSAVDDMERSAGWVSMAAGHHLGVGGRGSVLAPAPRLGAILIEDEANPAFKDDRSPRFDARVVALDRTSSSGAACVFVTSAPSIEVAALVGQGARLIRPGEDRLRSSRPNVELAEPTADGLSRELHRAIRDTLSEGGSAGLLVPQRGYARSLWCAACHRSVRCPRCEAGVVYERERLAARCPRCSFTGRAPDACPSCGAAELISLGAGSERLAEQLDKIFPRATVRRIDPNVLEGLSEAPDMTDADIYVTTWIGTKAALRPSVSLVGVLDADTMIRRPDMRAAESGYLALMELARWAGPASEGGRLLIQTREPAHHAIQAVVRADPWYFIERETPIRRDLNYPPFSELIKVRARGDRWAPVLDRVTALGEVAGAKVLGPVPILVDGDEAHELLLKCRDAQAVASALRVILPEVPRGTTLWVDVDPR